MKLWTRDQIIEKLGLPRFRVYGNRYEVLEPWKEDPVFHVPGEYTFESLYRKVAEEDCFRGGITIR